MMPLLNNKMEWMTREKKQGEWGKADKNIMQPRQSTYVSVLNIYCSNMHLA